MRPLHLGEERPELRAVRSLSLAFGDAHGTTREIAAERVREWIEALEGGMGFRELVIRARVAAGGRGDGVLGAFPPGVLSESFDGFLCDAALGEVSGLIETPSALHIIQRIELHAAVRQLFIEGRGEDVRQRLLGLRAQIVDGASFRELAREHSMDLPSAERGGDYAVFERGPRDQQLKRAAFELVVGELSGAIETPLGWHLLQRVEVSELSPELVEQNWGRFRAVLITHAGSSVAPNAERSSTEARMLAEEIHARVSRGEPFEPIARFSNDDPGGKARAGDLGWIHRKTPGLPPFLVTGFLMEVGELGPAMETGLGWVIIERE